MEYEVISQSDVVRINVQLTRLEFLHSFSGILVCHKCIGYLCGENMDRRRVTLSSDILHPLYAILLVYTIELS